MTKLIAVLILAASVAGAATDVKKSKKKAAVTAKTQTAQVVTIPKDAVLLPNGTYSYTDKQGKKWIYVNTPFGVSKTADPGASQAGSEAVRIDAKVIDKGDSVRFEKPSPFGTMSWEKKKSELTPEEQQLVDAQAPKPEAGLENK
jgi:hypothetical protein